MNSDEIDWNEIWKTRMLQRKASAAMECECLWADRRKALRYLESSREKSRGWVDNTIGAIRVGYRSRVLDIGAGPGTMAVPFARKASHVTAVEPAAGMADLLEERCMEYGLKTTGGSLKTSSMRDREFVNRFCAFQLLPMDAYRGDMDDFLAQGLKEMNSLTVESLQQLSDRLRVSLRNNYSSSHMT